MTAAALSYHKPLQQGLRRSRPLDDMAAAGNLLETAFGDDLDATGHRMVREMRRFGEMGLPGKIIGFLFKPGVSLPAGFVWMEEGQLVGNAHTVRVPGYPRRWVLANVAVHPDYQRQGIGRALIKACIEDLLKKGTEEIMLQVRAEHQGAIELYESFGFNRIITRRQWRTSSLNAASLQQDRLFPVQLRQPQEWEEQADLAQRLHPEGLSWPSPAIKAYFQSGQLTELLGLGKRRHWIWREQGRMLGSLTMRWKSEGRYWQCLLVVEPEARGIVEPGLISVAVRELRLQRATLRLDYPVGPADHALSKMGFRLQRTLTWMRLVHK